MVSQYDSHHRRYLTSSWDDDRNRAGFLEAVDAVDAALADPSNPSGGPYFVGKDVTIVDLTFAPFLERAAASIAYYKGDYKPRERIMGQDP